MIFDLDGIVAGLERRVEERRAAGDYVDLDWLDAEVEVLLEADTPVDVFLQTPRASPSWTQAAEAQESRTRAAVTRLALPGFPRWDELDREVDDRLREAIAWLRLALQSEQWAREQRDGILGKDLAIHSKELGILADEIGRVSHQVSQGFVAAVEMENVVSEMERRLRALEIDRAQKEADSREASQWRAETPAVITGIPPGSPDLLQPRLRALEVEAAVQRTAARSAASAGAPRQTRPASTAEPPASGTFDYLGFEDRFRGPDEQIAERLRHHLPRLADQGPVLDLGCGRGELLCLLRDNGTDARGVDSNPHMAEVARASGLPVEQIDLFAALDACESESLGAVTAFHVIEHLSLGDQLRLIRASRRALRPGGILLLETPNPLSLVAGSINFLRDPTHVRPLHPDTLAFMLESEGFVTAEIEHLAPVPPEHRVPRVQGSSDTAKQVNAALDVIDDWLLGPQDFAVIGTR